ncbi:MAG: hypothetical protein AB8B51_00570, partial [Sedimentitalea sp.]
MARTARNSVFAAAILSVALPVSAVQAQSAASPLYVVILKAGEFGSQNYTQVLLGNIAAAQQFCAALGDPSYRIDCLAERLGLVAKSIPENTDYVEIKGILKSTSDQLADVARTNRDRALPRARVTTPGAAPQTTSRPLTPVSKAALPTANQQATAILN